MWYWCEPTSPTTSFFYFQVIWIKFTKKSNLDKIDNINILVWLQISLIFRLILYSFQKEERVNEGNKSLYHVEISDINRSITYSFQKKSDDKPNVYLMSRQEV